MKKIPALLQSDPENFAGKTAKTSKLYGCTRRNCEAINRDWEVFETGWPDRIRHWCLGHIPWHVRLKMRLREMASRSPLPEDGLS